MKIDTTVHQGNDDKSAVIFIHGLGMDKDIWVNPLNSRILGGMFPLKIILQKRPSNENHEFLPTLFYDLRAKGYTVLTWSHRRPASIIDTVVTELQEVINMARDVTKSGIILIGHSRGGLIARKYLLQNVHSIKGLITISAPHGGSSVARLSRYVSPLASVLNPLIPDGERGTLSHALKRIVTFLKSKALRELLPDSKFFKTLHDGPREDINYISIGGTNPTLFHVANLSFPDIFEKIVPEHLYPEEMKKGRGDGLVSAESAKIPWAVEHYNFHFNHAEILFQSSVRKLVVESVEMMNQ